MTKDECELLEYLAKITQQDMIYRDIVSIYTISEGVGSRICAKTTDNKEIILECIGDYEKILTKTQIRKNKIETIIKDK